MLLKDMIADGYYPNLIVDPAYYEPKHPQESLPSIKDPVALYRPAPERDRSGQTIRIGTGPGFPGGSGGGNGPEDNPDLPPGGGFGAGSGAGSTGSLTYGFELGAPSVLLSPAPPDPDWIYVSLLAEWNGPDQATSYTEISTNELVATFFGNAQLDTAFPHFGVSSLLLDGSGDFVTFPDDPDFNLFDGNFTLEAWIRLASLPPLGSSSDPGYSVISQWGATPSDRAFAMEISRDAFGTRIRGRFQDTIQEGFELATISVSLNTWYHIAMVRNLDDLYFYFNGNRIFNSVIFDSFLVNSSQPLRIGSLDGVGSFFDGVIGGVRITRDIARYFDDTYTVPTGEFPLGE